MPYNFNNPSSSNVDNSWDLLSPTNVEPLTYNRGRTSPHTSEANNNHNGTHSSICPAFRYQRRNAFSQFNLANLTSTNNCNHSQNHHPHPSPHNNFPSSHSHSPTELPPRIHPINHQTFEWPAFSSIPLASGVEYQPTPLSAIDSNSGQYSPNVDGHTAWDNTDYDSLFGDTNNDFWTDLTSTTNDNPIIDNPFSDSNHRTASENAANSLNQPHFSRADSNSNNYHSGGFVDLTASSPTDTTEMAPTTRKRAAAQLVESSPPARTATASSSSSSSSSRPISTNPTNNSHNHNTANPSFRTAVDLGNKRRRLSSTTIPPARPCSTSIREAQNNRPKEIDLTAIDEDDAYVSTMLREQQASAARAQQRQRDPCADAVAQQAKEQETTKLSDVMCIICLETMTDMTVTHCGHLFCHTCIMEALIAGENQSNPGDPAKGTSKCPVCRKKIVRPGGKGRDRREIIPLEIKCVTRSQLAKGKGRART
ncbi:MAG: hypothetical protein LQ350_006933 [Teloschistes chrysophthalmus]|nr:MAG: hypothetical protein LQ350_006933 [Niorma chrysophthalma]